jgi:hypothetical protein
MNINKIKESLNNDKIILQCEFEYMSYDRISYDDMGYKEAYESWSAYKKAVNSFRYEYENTLKELLDIEIDIDKEKDKIKQTHAALLDIRSDIDLVPMTIARKTNTLREDIKKCKEAINILRELYEDTEIKYKNVKIAEVDLNPYIKYMGEQQFNPILWVLEGGNAEFMQEPLIKDPYEEIKSIDFSGLSFIDECEITSFGTNEVKITLPKLPLSKALKYIENICEWIESGNGETNDNCICRVLMMREDTSNSFYIVESNYSKKVEKLLDIIAKESYIL